MDTIIVKMSSVKQQQQQQQIMKGRYAVISTNLPTNPNIIKSESWVKIYTRKYKKV